jgi:hypothetical protein
LSVLTSLALICTCLALGLGGVAAGLAPSGSIRGEIAQEGPEKVIIDSVERAIPDASRDEPVAPHGAAIDGDPDAQADPVAAPQTSLGRPPVSPLYPQNGVTLWDRVRVSTQRDRRAYLLGTAIQIHAPAVAATPGP